MQRRFGGQMHSLARSDDPVEFCNPQRFKPLHGAAKPLWEFKEDDHRLYCVRFVHGKHLTVVLLDGWVKGGNRKNREDREIEKALGLLDEFLMEYPNGGI